MPDDSGSSVKAHPLALSEGYVLVKKARKCELPS